MAGRLGAHGRRVIEAMERGVIFRRAGEGWRGGVVAAPDSLVDELRRRDLVRAESGRLALTAAGIGFTARTLRPESANRLLAERALPRDGEERANGESKAPRIRARSVTVNLAESPLGWLRARGLLSDRQFDAGERLRGDYERAQLGARVTMRWDAAAPSRTARGPADPSDPTLGAIAAKRRFEGAIAAIGPGLADIAWRVICAGEGIETAEKALGWPKRAGKLVLLMALDRVADFHGLPGAADNNHIGK